MKLYTGTTFYFSLNVHHLSSIISMTGSNTLDLYSRSICIKVTILRIQSIKIPGMSVILEQRMRSPRQMISKYGATIKSLRYSDQQHFASGKRHLKSWFLATKKLGSAHSKRMAVISVSEKYSSSRGWTPVISTWFPRYFFWNMPGIYETVCCPYGVEIQEHETQAGG